MTKETTPSAEILEKATAAQNAKNGMIVYSGKDLRAIASLCLKQAEEIERLRGAWPNEWRFAMHKFFGEKSENWYCVKKEEFDKMKQALSPNVI